VISGTLGFESGDLTGWSSLGSVSVVAGSDSLAQATEGTFFAYLTSGIASEGVLEQFLGIAPGGLQSLTTAVPTVGSALETTSFLTAGQQVSVDWQFMAHDYLPYDDFAFVSVNGDPI